MMIRARSALAATGAAALAAGTYAHAAFFYVPVFTTQRITIQSTWETDGAHPYAIWQAASARWPGLYPAIRNHAAVDFGPMYPRQVYKSLGDVRTKDGAVYITAGTSFVKLDGGPLNRYGGDKYCTWNINNVGYPNGRWVVRLFTPPRAIGSYNSMTCVETGKDGRVAKIHDVRTDNLALLTETKDAFLYGGPDIKPDDQIAFEKTDSRAYRTGGNTIFKVIALSVSADKDNQTKVCLDEILTFIPPIPPSIKIGEACFDKIGTKLDAFDGQYQLTAATAETADITILKPFDSPEIKPD